ncbi:hypothetical protein R6Q59_016359 [Mikania micrantha]
MGKDTRKSFVGHLYHALHQKGINAYKDDERIEKGERISPQLIGSIKDSRFHIIVFSKKYADSKWCLDELVNIIECQETKEQTAYPVFYKVEPTQVRNQEGPVGEAFAKAIAKHEKKEDAGKWRKALTEAGSRSRIIITTRDEQVLNAHQVNIIHEVQLLSDKEAIRLFSKGAFKREIPDEEYKELSNNVVDYAGGLPLTVKVLGSSLCGCSKNVWTDAIRRLKEILEKKTWDILKISYDGLQEDQKKIFLDVACILKGETKDEAIRILESCEFYATCGLDVLEKKSLITIFSDGRLCLHNHIEEMARNIVRSSNPGEPQEHSRLWIREEIEEILVQNLGTATIESIKLPKTSLSPDIIMKGLEKMTKLRFIHVDNGSVDHINSSGASLPDALRYIYWRNYPFCSLPITYLGRKRKRSNINEENERKVK